MLSGSDIYGTSTFTLAALARPMLGLSDSDSSAAEDACSAKGNRYTRVSTARMVGGGWAKAFFGADGGSDAQDCPACKAIS